MFVMIFIIKEHVKKSLLHASSTLLRFEVIDLTLLPYKVTIAFHLKDLERGFKLKARQNCCSSSYYLLKLQ